MATGKKVLIVEDEVMLADNLKSHLEHGSFVARIAADGASAIRMAGEFRPEVVVIDFRLPDMSGFQVFDALRGCCAQSAWVLITAHPSGLVTDGAVDRGIEHVLFKPFPLAELSKLARTVAPICADRRLSDRSDFPLKLYDGSWVYADRRKGTVDPS